MGRIVDHRSNEVVEKLVYTVKKKFLALTFELSKPSINSLKKLFGTSQLQNNSH